jgi:pilus assembly protein Flp/PilA
LARPGTAIALSTVVVAVAPFAWPLLAHNLAARRGAARTKERPMNLITRMHSLRRDTEGQDLLEYALLIALIALVAYAAVQTTGTNVSAIFTNIATKLGTAAGAGA